MGSLHVASLAAADFRSHTALRLELDARPVALHGPNGAGKTNILEAVSLLSPGRGLRRAPAREMCRRPGAEGWRVEGVVQAPGAASEIEIRFDAESGRQVRIGGKAASRGELGRAARVLWLVPAMDRLWTEGAGGRRRFVDRAAMSFVPEHADAVLDYEKAMRERNRLLKRRDRDDRWHLALERRMAQAAAQIHRNRADAAEALNRAQADGGGAFPSARIAVTPGEGGEHADESAFCAALARGRPRDMAAGRTLAGPHRADLEVVYAERGVAARECSTGEQKALLLSLILANARALAGRIGAAPVLLLDEVAAHLDAARRAALYDEICALGAQAWMTGTGPELFADLGDRARLLEIGPGG